MSLISLWWPKVHPLSVICPIEPSRVDNLRTCLDRLPRGVASPLAKTGTTHFGRWVVIDQMHDEDGHASSDELSCPYLLFTSNHDGRTRTYLKELVGHSHEDLHELWSYCIGYPKVGGDDALVDYLMRNRIRTNLFFVGYPRATVPDVCRALDLRYKFIAFSVGSQSPEAGPLAPAFRSCFKELAE